MLFSCLGTCISGDIINKAKEHGWKIVSNHVSYSLFSLVDGCDINVFNILGADYIRNLADTDVNKERIEQTFGESVYESIKNNNPDYVLTDLIDFRIGEYVLNIEGYGKLSIGINILKNEQINELRQILADRLETKVELKTISINSLSDEELESYIKRHIERMKSEFGSKVIFFKSLLVANYIDGNEIKYTSDFQVTGNTNDIIDRIYAIAEKYANFIKEPSFMIGDKKCLAPFEYHYCQPYYEYMIRCVSYYIDKKNDSALEEYHNKVGIEIFELYHRIFCKHILDNLKVKKLISSKMVLISRSRLFELMLNENGGELYSYIYYDSASDINEIEERIHSLQNESEGLIFIAPELFRHEEGTLWSVFYRRHLIENVHWYTYSVRYHFESICGKFIDCFNNEVNLVSINKISFNGQGIYISVSKHNGKHHIIARTGSYVQVGESLFGSNVIIDAWQDTQCVIGKNLSSPINGLTITLPFYGKVHIGEDVMCSWDTRIHAGDGHAIFEIQENEYTLISPLIYEEIHVGSHCWLGLKTTILSGVKLGDGSICGAGSILTGKRYPNNCVVAGSPAKIIRDNIAWCRNPSISLIEQDNYVLTQWANPTSE